MKLRNEFKNHLIGYKLLYTAIIVMAYLLGRFIPLYGVDTSAYAERTLDSESLMMQVIGGDINQYSLFALGISPYMVASIFASTAVALRKSDNKGRISPITINRITILITVAVAGIQAYIRSRDLIFRYDGALLFVCKGISIVEMMVGALIILWMSERNKRYGIGGQSALIFINVILSIIAICDGQKPIDLLIPIAVSTVIMNVFILLETTEKRIPLQRISIHNIYADKNYLAIKLNPIGIMPVMFATAFFTVPQMLFAVIAAHFQKGSWFDRVSQQLNLQTQTGIIVYLIILFVISMFFTFIFINPRDITEQFLKSGDSLVNIHAGKETKRYLTLTLLKTSLFSSLVMCLGIGIPLMLRVIGAVESELSMLPTTVMILTGIWSTLYQELVAIKKLDSYNTFI